MRILVTGQYDPNYNRTKILLEGLRRHTDVILLEHPFKRQGLFDLQAFTKLEKEADWIYIPPFCHRDVAFIKKYTEKPLAFDPLISRYLTKVFDYKQIWRYSPRAVKNYFKDKVPFKKCDLLIADTHAHADYYAKTFKIDRQKIKTLPIGVNTNEYNLAMEPEHLESHTFNVGFYGGFIPLQGVYNIVKAAKLLLDKKHINFSLIGNGFEYESIESYIRYHQIDNVKLEGWIDYNELPDALLLFDCCLGIFGVTKKSDLVIPNKIYHYAALGKPIISKDSPAIREVFEHEKNIILCSSNPKDIANSVIELSKAKNKASKIGNAAYELITREYNQDQIASRLISILRNHSNKKDNN